MFGWRRRSEGFEWKEYVRTTVLVRRADRQRRVEDARAAAVEKVKHVADAGAEAGRASASYVGSQFSKILSFIVEALLDLAAATFLVAVRWAKFSGAVFSDAFATLLAPLAKAFRVPIGAARDKMQRWPDFVEKFPIKSHHVIVALVALGLIYIGGPMLRSADGVAVADIPSEAAKPVTVSTDISGRALAIAGDLMKVDGTLVRINGIEAPSTGQPCYRANGRRWNCASVARSGLARIVRGRNLTCTPSGQDNRGYVLADCRIGQTDVAKALVQHGYVFAVRSFFGQLNETEDAARAAKKGIWQGKVQRPQEWRDQQWQDAARTAPDGCPIKGVVRASSKYYALPWSAGYSRTKVRTDRGGRWFCSEDEARAAGFTLSSRS
jgi:endonuclease YncB( thermonuclease family)